MVDGYGQNLKLTPNQFLDVILDDQILRSQLTEKSTDSLRFPEVSFLLYICRASKSQILRLSEPGTVIRNLEIISKYHPTAPPSMNRNWCPEIDVFIGNSAAMRSLIYVAHELGISRGELVDFIIRNLMYWRYEMTLSSRSCSGSKSWPRVLVYEMPRVMKRNLGSEINNLLRNLRGYFDFDFRVEDVSQPLSGKVSPRVQVVLY